MKLFIATPISSLSNPEEYEAYRKTVTQLVSTLRKEHVVNCEIDEIESETQYDSPKDSFNKDYSAISNCDAFILHYPSPSPTSALIELGFAIALNKMIIIITPNRSNLPYLVQTLDEVGKNYCIVESNELGTKTIKTIIEVLR